MFRPTSAATLPDAYRRRETDELHHHDQRPGGGLGHAEPVEHLARPQPAIGLDRLLRHIGKHGIGTAEGDNGHLGEEGADIGEDVARTEQREQRDDRHQPKREPKGGNAEGPAGGGPGMVRQAVTEQAFVGAGLGGAMPAPDLKRG